MTPDLRCPEGHKLTEEQVKRLWAQLTQAKRKRKAGGTSGGRPRICKACGEKIPRDEPPRQDETRHLKCQG